MPEPAVQPVRVLFWDLGNVLVPFSHDVIWRNFARLLPLSRILLWGWRRKTLQERLSGVLGDFETGHCTFREVHAALEDVLGTKLEYEAARRAWNEMFGPLGETARFALDLAGKYPSYVLSNTNQEHIDYVLERCPELGGFAGILTSCGLHALKPSPEIFRLALEKAGAAPGECLLVDDIEENVEGARECGLKAVKYTNLPNLCSDFADYGVGL